MNCPVWGVALGAGLLMALVSILDVFVSHFAVGGGLFLVLTAKRALQKDDKPHQQTGFEFPGPGSAFQWNQSY